MRKVCKRQDNIPIAFLTLTCTIAQNPVQYLKGGHRTP